MHLRHRSRQLICFLFCVIVYVLIRNNAIVLTGLVQIGLQVGSLLTDRKLSDFEGTRSRLRKVIAIVTRARCGSSFTGEMFDKHPDVFYIYEPLHELFSQYNVSWLLVKDNTLTRAQKTKLKTRILGNILNCKPDEYYPSEYHSRDNSVGHGLMRQSSAISRFVSCESLPHLAQSYTRKQCRKITLYDFQQNKAVLYPRVCLAYNYSVAKLIRMTVSEAGELLNRYDINLHILHLIRDPRGMLRSWYQHAINEKPIAAIQSDASNFCDSIYQDVLDGAALKRKYPSRYMLLRYEDLAAEPKSKIAEVYKFLNIPLHSDVLHWVDQNTFATANRTNLMEDTFNHWRRNSTKTSLQWMSDVSEAAIKAIEERCIKLLKVAHYPILHYRH